MMKKDQTLGFFHIFVYLVNIRDVIVPAFPGTLLLSQWMTTKAIPGKTGTNHIPVIYASNTSIIQIVK